MEDFPGRREGEEVLVFARRHPFFLFRSIIVPLSLLTFLLTVGAQTGVLAAIISSRGPVGMVIGALAILLVALGLVFWGFLEWENDHCIVTTERVIMIRRVYKVYEERKEAEVSRVQDVVTRTPGLTGTLLGYADVQVSTAGALGAIVFSRIPQPAQVVETVLQQRDAASRVRLDATRDSVRQTLQREIGIG